MQFTMTGMEPLRASFDRGFDRIKETQVVGSDRLPIIRHNLPNNSLLIFLELVVQSSIKSEP